MNPHYYALMFTLGLFAGMVFFLELGRRIAAVNRAPVAEGGGRGIAAVEGTIFALLGLLIAFTFNGAYVRFDARRQLITEEANAIGTAWLRLELLPAGPRAELNGLFQRYVESRLATYRKLPDLAAARAEMAQTAGLQDAIWKRAVAACESEGGQRATMLLLPALNQMIDMTTTQEMATETHPPLVIFGMLAVIAIAAAFVAGNGMGVRGRSWIHIAGFALILSLSVYVILDLEYPRLGFIRVDAFDHVLEDLLKIRR